MKRIHLLMILGTIAFAQNYDYEYKNPYNNNKQVYKSNTGTKYQYDMSDPLDRTDYRTDTDAQMRDRMNVNPYRSIDQRMDQVGGGIYDD